MNTSNHKFVFSTEPSEKKDSLLSLVIKDIYSLKLLKNF